MVKILNIFNEDEECKKEYSVATYLLLCTRKARLEFGLLSILNALPSPRIAPIRPSSAGDLEDH